jgi:hypothetical protein
VNYCEHCGAANDILNEQCYRCGYRFAHVEEPLATATGPAIGQDLELPDWLKRAAAETPATPAPVQSATQNRPPAGFHVAGSGGGPTTDDLFLREPERPVAPPPPAKPLPPVPTAGLPNAIPDWLRQQSAAKPAVPEPEATDTSSFISENDLPEWIRQIAEADAVKKAEEERLAAEAAARKVETAAPKRIVLPGETAPSAPAANPWLTRRDGPTSASSWGQTEPAATAPIPAPEAVAPPVDADETNYGAAPASVPTPKKGRKLSMPSVSTPSLPRASLPKASLPKLSVPTIKRSAGESGSSPQTMRVILLAALVVLLLIIVAMSML